MACHVLMLRQAFATWEINRRIGPAHPITLYKRNAPSSFKCLSVHVNMGKMLESYVPEKHLPQVAEFEKKTNC